MTVKVWLNEILLAEETTREAAIAAAIEEAMAQNAIGSGKSNCGGWETVKNFINNLEIEEVEND